MKTHLHVACYAGLGFLLAYSAWAFPNEDMNPLPPDARPGQIPLQEFNGGLRETNSEGEVLALVFKVTVAGQSVDVRLADGGNGMLLMDSVVDGEAKVSQLPVTDVGNWFVSVMAGDLNQDGIQDYLIERWHGGCGWAGGGETVTFVLSTGETFKTTSILANYPRPENFVMLGEKPCFIHTAIGSVGDPERKLVEYYYVHNILVIDGTTIRLDNSLYPGFPMIQSDHMVSDGDASPEPVKSVLDGKTDAERDGLIQDAIREIFR